MDASCSSSASVSTNMNKLVDHLQKQPLPPHAMSRQHPQQQRPSLQVSLDKQESAYFDSVFNQPPGPAPEMHAGYAAGKMPEFRAIEQRLQDEFSRYEGWTGEFDNFENAGLSNAELETLERQFDSINSNWNTQFSSFEQDHQLDKAFQEFSDFEALNHFTETPASLISANESGHESAGDIGSDWASDFLSQQQRIPAGEYPFEHENPYLNHPQPLEHAQKLQAEGNLAQAILAYEAHLQRNTTDIESWTILGQLQAENEKEIPAILALQHALTLNPQSLPALLSLAVSYTNESYDDEAFKLLYRWATTKYALPPAVDVDVTPSYEIYNATSDILLDKIRTSGGEIDADVQIALGLVFYNAGQQDKAIDCFKTALSVRPEDYTLWNRVGATLANSGQSEQAIDAYFKALEIKPSYVRARYNLGVSCMNIGCFKDAAEHFLGALSICGGVRNVADNLWDTLRRCFILMERPDLVELAKNGTDLKLFRKDFEY